jgi:hypothetical protein
VSFFDDDEPRTTRARPRKPVTSGAGPGTDPQQLLVRRLVAAGVGVVVIIVLVFSIQGCLDSRTKQALKDYNRDVAGLVQQSDANTKDFFDALTTGGTDPIDVTSQINVYRLRAKALTTKGEKQSVPDDMKPAQRSLLLALGLIEETIGKVADKIPAALSTDSATAEPAVISITAEMEAFLAADVVYTRRTVALIKQVLGDNDIGGQTIQASSFLPNLGWLDPPTVARRIHADAARGAGADTSSKAVAAGTHGHGLIAVSVGNATLASGATASNEIPASPNLTFNVKIANQGENPETDVRVRITVRPGSGGKAVTQTKSVDQTAAGTEVTVPVVFAAALPTGTAEITAEVLKVPGETNTSNNSQKFPAIIRK